MGLTGLKVLYRSFPRKIYIMEISSLISSKSETFIISAYSSRKPPKQYFKKLE